MKPFFYAVILVSLAAGCKPKAPGNIIVPDKIGGILYDIHVTDAYITTMPNADSAKNVAAAYYKGIYKKFGTDSAQYSESMNYYSARPDLLSKIYETVTAKLKKSKDSLDKVNAKALKLKTEKRAKVVKDSLSKIDPKILKMEAAKKAEKTKDSLEKVKKDNLIRIRKDSLERIRQERLIRVNKKKDSINKAKAKPGSLQAVRVN